MFCSKCGKEIEKTTFCPYCGAKQEKEKKVEPKSEKKKGKGRIIVCVILLLVAGAAGVGIYRYIQQRIPDKYIKLVQEGKTEEAQSLYSEKIAGNDQQLDTTYQKVSDDIKKIKDDFNDEVIAYETAREELAGYSSFYKTEVDNAISELDRLKESKAAFQQAEEKYQKEEYEQAYMYYKEVDKEDSGYKAAQAHMQDCYQILLDQVLELAGDYENKKEYLKAIDVLEEKTGIWNDSDLKMIYEKIDDFKESYLAEKIDDLQGFIDTENYEDAYGLLKQVKEDIGEAEMLTDIEEELNENYKKNISDQIDSAIGDRNIEEAMQIVHSAEAYLPEDEDLLVLEDKIKEYVPVSMSDMEPYAESGISTGENIDTMGNTYVYAFKGYRDMKDGEAYAIYDISGQYNYFNATVAVRKKSNGIDKKFIGHIRIYGDDRLLWSDDNITSITKPYDIQVDIKNVEDLKIEMYGAGNLGMSGISVLLGNPTLSK